MTFDDSQLLSIANEEITTWRNYFLDEMFSNEAFRFIPEKDKNLLQAYFLSCPTASFKNPWKLWNECLAALLQGKDEK